MDDILVTGASEEEHLRNLEEVLSRLKKSGLRLKRSKCTFLGKEVVFLGHKIGAAGVQPVAEKVQSIQEAQTPRSREVPQMASPRIQRWAVTLCGYEYTTVYKAGKEHQNADGLSRLPLIEKGVETPAEEESVLLLEENDVPLVKAE
ncbi:hypothetical protein QTP86_020813, partial [Hemibagrus guttatus]